MVKRITAQHMVDRLCDQGFKGRPPLNEVESEIMGLFASEVWDRFPEALDILADIVDGEQVWVTSSELTDNNACEGHA